MKLCNCNYYELEKRLADEKIILFGVGDYFHYYIAEHIPLGLVKNIVYFIDNNATDSYIQIYNRKIPIYKPTRLIEEKNCVVMLTSSNYMKEMYQQLESLKLDDSIKCYAYPMILANSVGSGVQLQKIFNSSSRQKIPKVIHCFWFSGDKKPEAYQKCIDSWKRICPDYKINEWNMSNYDYTKNQFMKQAIEAKKWAFASDFARLDIIYQQGGIYMDMDVELIKLLDDFLGNKAFFTYDMNLDIDLGTFGSEPRNILIKNLMRLYDNVEFNGDLKSMNWFCQPRYIRTALKEFGVKLDGNMQIIDDMVFLPRNYLSPKDQVIYESGVISKNTYAIHHYNAGWKEDDYRSKRVKNNREIWKVIYRE